MRPAETWQRGLQEPATWLLRACVYTDCWILSWCRYSSRHQQLTTVLPRALQTAAGMADLQPHSQRRPRVRCRRRVWWRRPGRPRAMQRVRCHARGAARLASHRVGRALWARVCEACRWPAGATRSRARTSALLQRALRALRLRRSPSGAHPLPQRCECSMRITFSACRHARLAVAGQCAETVQLFIHALS